MFGFEMFGVWDVGMSGMFDDGTIDEVKWATRSPCRDARRLSHRAAKSIGTLHHER